MPRNYKFIIGDRIIKIQLDLLELLIEAYYSNRTEVKLVTLYKANIQLEKLRQLMQICVDMRFIGLKQFEYSSKKLFDIGVLLGGWIKYLQGSKEKFLFSGCRLMVNHQAQICKHPEWC